MKKYNHFFSLDTKQHQNIYNFLGVQAIAIENNLISKFICLYKNRNAESITTNKFYVAFTTKFL